MEPKFSDDKINSYFPPEPSLSPTSGAKNEIPKIVPADFKAPPTPQEPVPQTPEVPQSQPAVSPNPAVSTTTAAAAPASPAPAAHKPAVSAPRDPKELMAQLSREVNELSQPYQADSAQKETPAASLPGVLGAEGIRYPAEDDLGDPLDPPKRSGFFRSVMLLICFLAIVVSTWQVTLFLQPEILQKEPLNRLSEASCKYLYCPPLRTPVVLASKVEAQPSGTWLLQIQVQNQDMRSQKLPNLQLILEGANGSKTQKIFLPSEYKTEPKIEAIKGGGIANIEVPFDYPEGRPTAFRIKVLED